MQNLYGSVLFRHNVPRTSLRSRDLEWCVGGKGWRLLRVLYCTRLHAPVPFAHFLFLHDLDSTSLFFSIVYSALVKTNCIARFVGVEATFISDRASQSQILVLEVLSRVFEYQNPLSLSLLLTRHPALGIIVTVNSVTVTSTGGECWIRLRRLLHQREELHYHNKCFCLDTRWTCR